MAVINQSGLAMSQGLTGTGTALTALYPYQGVYTDVHQNIMVVPANLRPGDFAIRPVDNGFILFVMQSTGAMNVQVARTPQEVTEIWMGLCMGKSLGVLP